ncbi:MAG: hypothetical protein OEV78_03860 [Spirochaetia bacterium]|nr:hypothetical protein [Spirochaetia bacterium]
MLILLSGQQEFYIETKKPGFVMIRNFYIKSEVSESKYFKDHSLLRSHKM